MAVGVIGLAGLTAGIGALVEQSAASADATRVADDLSAALEPVETTGWSRGEVRFTAGSLRTIDRDVRVLDGAGTVRRIESGGLVFEASGRRVAYLNDAVFRQTAGNAWLHEPPPLTVSRSGGNGVFVASVVRLDVSDVAVTGDSETSVEITGRVTHTRTPLGNGSYGLAIETTTPRPLERWFEGKNATVSRRDFDGDGIESVVARFPGTREGYLVVHDVDLEVANR
jgi:hypothetical protein